MASSYVQLPADFFQGLIVDFWCGVTSAQWTEQEHAFLQQVFSEQSAIAAPLGEPCRLLDVFCGHGRHLASLSRAGYQMVGLDVSEGFLKKAAQAAPGVTLIQGDILDLPAARVGQVHGAYCLGNSLGYFNRPDTQRFCRFLSDTLYPGGRLVLQSAMLAESLLPNWETRMEMVACGVHAVIENRHYDPANSRMETVFSLSCEALEQQPDSLQKKASETKTLRHHIYTTGELVGMLDEAGLKLVQAYADCGHSPYELGSEQWYGVFEKIKPD